jgi:predicted ATPase
MAQELDEQLVRLAQSVQDPDLLIEAYFARGVTSFWLGQTSSAQEYLEQSLMLYDPQQHHSHAFLYGTDPGVSSYSYNALTLWHLGYPDQAVEEIHKGLNLSQRLAHPFSRAYVLNVSAWLYRLRRDGQAAQAQADAAISLATEHELPHWLSFGKVQRGGALAQQGQAEEGILQIHQGLTEHRALGAEAGITMLLAALAEAYRASGQNEEGLHVVTEALDIVNKKGEQSYEAELYRLKGELLLAQASKLRD